MSTYFQLGWKWANTFLTMGEICTWWTHRQHMGGWWWQIGWPLSARGLLLFVLPCKRLSDISFLWDFTIHMLYLSFQFSGEKKASHCQWKKLVGFVLLQRSMLSSLHCALFYALMNIEVHWHRSKWNGFGQWTSINAAHMLKRRHI